MPDSKQGPLPRKSGERATNELPHLQDFSYKQLFTFHFSYTFFQGGDYILQYKQFGKQKTSRVWQKYLFGMLSFVQVFVLGNLAVKVSRYVILSSIEHYMDK